MDHIYEFGGISVFINGEMSTEEAHEYVKRAPQEVGKKLKRIDIEVDGEYVNLSYVYSTAPFHRIRRITGYLVGNLTRFNDAKLAEVKDRTKHSV